VDAELAEILAHWDFPAGETTAVRPASGLIQVTWIVTFADGSRAVAQKMNPIFSSEVLEDIEAVTAHLEARGLVTPRLVRTRDGKLGVVGLDGRTWRILTYVPGRTVDRVEGPEMAGAAAAAVARFHAALVDLRHEFRFARSGVHDTAAHFARLTRAVDGAPPPIAALGREILALGATLPPLEAALPKRIGHGDLKISNLLFADGGEARCLIDLDTVARMPIAHELGDALRSWCNPLGEDVTETRFDGGLYDAALAGYLAAAPVLSAAEIASIPIGLLTIATELAARFCTDAIEDRYFGWDASRFPSRRAHNEVRARGQLCLARAVADYLGPSMSSGRTH
jgi:Ser/Thr protein kinase RdoA (MazF antagonist)